MQTSRLRSLAVLSIVFSALAAALPARAAVLTQEDYAAVNRALAANHAVPRYEHLAREAAALRDTAGSYCAGEKPVDIDALKAQFGDTADAWIGVEHLEFGPSVLFMRNFRFNYWPQARGRISGALADVLADGIPSGEKAMSEASVALQGLPALEFMLYGDTPPEPDSEACALTVAIAGNLETMAAEIASAWTDEEGFAADLAAPGPGNAYYMTERDETLDLFKSLYGGLLRIVDLKLLPVAGKSIEEARPDLAESVESERSLRNIVLNLDALEELYTGKGDTPGLGELVRRAGTDEGLDALLRKAFRLTRETAASIDGPFAEAVADPARRPQVEKLVTQARALKQIVADRLAPALGLSTGFNALDGD